MRSNNCIYLIIDKRQWYNTHSKQTVTQDSSTEWIFTEYLYSAAAMSGIQSAQDMDHVQLYLQIRPCLPFLRKRSPDGATRNWLSRHPIATLLLIYRPPRDERLSWPGWLTYSGRFTHEWSSAGQGSSPAIDRRSTAVPRNQPRAHFSVYYYTTCLLLKAGCATLKRKVCNIKFLR